MVEQKRCWKNEKRGTEKRIYSNKISKTKPLYVILSGERSSKSNFCEVNNGAEAQGVSRSGIWLEISVAFEPMLHLLW